MQIQKPNSNCPKPKRAAWLGHSALLSTMLAASSPRLSTRLTLAFHRNGLGCGGKDLHFPPHLSLCPRTASRWPASCHMTAPAKPRPGSQAQPRQRTGNPLNQETGVQVGESGSRNNSHTPGSQSAPPTHTHTPGVDLQASLGRCNPLLRLWSEE